MPSIATLLLILMIIGLGIAALGMISTFNGMVKLRNQVKNGWSQIDVQLKRRCDLIPNLVETAKGYMAHERETLEAVIRARQTVLDARSLPDQVAAENMLSGTLRQLFALSENYPDLKANQNMLALQEELTATENRVGFARQHYNDSVYRYNTSAQQFPANLIVGMLGFESSQPFFEVDSAEERKAPKVAFN